MKTWSIIVCTFLLASCGKIPECADPETTDLVKSIYWDLTQTSAKRLFTKTPEIYSKLGLNGMSERFAINLSKIEQTEKSDKQGYSCKATFAISPKGDTGLIKAVQSDNIFDVYVNTLFSFYFDLDANNKSMKMKLALSEEGAEFIKSYAVSPDDIPGKVTLPSILGSGQKLNSALAAGMLVPPLLSTLTLDRLQTIDTAVETLVGLDIAEGALSAPIEYSSTKKKVDGSDKHFVELRTKEEIHLFSVFYQFLAPDYNKGQQGINQVREAERLFINDSIGSWAGDYVCAGLNGETSGLKGPFKLQVNATVSASSSKKAAFEVTLNRTTQAGGIEKLDGIFSSKTADAWELRGSGRNSMDDSWKTVFRMKKTGKEMTGEGNIVADTGEILRKCDLKLAKQ